MFEKIQKNLLENKLVSLQQKWNILNSYLSEKFEKENQILICQNLIQKGISDLNFISRRDNLLESLIELNEKVIYLTIELEKGLNNVEGLENLYKENKIPSNFITICAKLNIPVEKVSFLKEIVKAYVEGVYADSTINRKLGRVGMTYAQYEQKLKNEGVQKEKKEHIKKDIPETLADLDFKQNEAGKFIAEYQIQEYKVQILMEKDTTGRKIFNINVKDKLNSNLLSHKNLDTDSMSSQLRLINRKFGIDEDEKMYLKMPLTPEELDEKWGDVGFTYTFHKENLDLIVKIREDSDKKSPRLNLYVSDILTGKRKSFTNLDLQQVHEELLKYDLNPILDNTLNNKQEAEFNEILLKEKYGDNLEEYKNSPKYKSLKFNRLQWTGKTGNPQHVRIDEGKLNLKISRYKGIYTIDIVRRDPFKKEQLKDLTVGDVSRFLDNFNSNYTSKEFNDKEDNLIPGLENANFVKNEATFKDKDSNLTVYFKNDNNTITIRTYNKKGILTGMESTPKENIKKIIDDYDLPNLKEEQSENKDFLYSNLGIKKEDLPIPKDIVISYNSPSDLLHIPQITSNERPSKVEIEKYKSDFIKIGLQDTFIDNAKKEIYTWGNNGSLEKWIADMPNSNKEGMSKDKIIANIKENSFQNIKDSNYSQKIPTVSWLKEKIINTYY